MKKNGIKKIKRAFRTLRASKLRLSVVLILILLIGGAILLWGFNVADVKAIIVEGNVVLTESKLESFVRLELNAPLLGPVFSGNLVTFPEARMRVTLMERFPRIASVEFARNILKQTLTLIVEERQAVGIYCSAREDVPDLLEGEDVVVPNVDAFPDIIVDACFLMDKDGIIFAAAPETEGSLIMTILDADSSDVAEGKKAIDDDALSNIISIWDAFKERVPVRAKRMLRRPDGILAIETFEGWEVLYTLEYPIESQNVALVELIKKELNVDKRKGVSVIDLRVPGRIYYR